MILFFQCYITFSGCDCNNLKKLHNIWLIQFSVFLSLFLTINFNFAEEFQNWSIYYVAWSFFFNWLLFEFLKLSALWANLNSKRFRKISSLMFDWRERIFERHFRLTKLTSILNKIMRLIWRRTTLCSFGFASR